MKIYDNIYFIGIGGIGMSAIARYFRREGRLVAGYDRTPTKLTADLTTEGIPVHFEDNVELIPPKFRDPATTLVIYTPAVPADHTELSWFRANEFTVEKRSQALGHIAAGKYVMAVAGTHGKTTTTTMIAWFNHVAGGGGSAFLGGISKNFGSNLVMGRGDRLAVEADEYDRSFLRLYPDVAVITSTDADHLDIYGTHEALKEAFGQFASQIKEGGTMIIKYGLELRYKSGRIKTYTYSYDDSRADFYAADISVDADGCYQFDIVCPDRTIKKCRLGVPGRINVENAIGAAAAAWVAGIESDDKLRTALDTFRGVLRRFDFYINNPRLVYMDDYAHHPGELEAALGSVRQMFPGRRIRAVFQPHLYSRTNDFHKEFARALSLADDVVLVPIYPARELPMQGVSSEMIGRLLSVPFALVEKERLAEYLGGRDDNDIVITFGAGDIDKHCAGIARELSKQLPTT